MQQRKFRGTVDFSSGGVLDITRMEIRDKNIYLIFECQLQSVRWKGVAMLTSKEGVWESSEFEMVMCSDSRVSAVTKIKLTKLEYGENELDLYGEMMFKHQPFKFDGIVDSLLELS